MRRSRGSGNELLCFVASQSFALGLSETFTRFFIVPLLLLLSQARVVVSHTLALHLLRRGAPLVVFPPVCRKALVISRRTGETKITMISSDGYT